LDDLVKKEMLVFGKGTLVLFENDTEEWFEKESLGIPLTRIRWDPRIIFQLTDNNLALRMISKDGNNINVERQFLEGTMFFRQN
jgi:hypothetical protein